MRFFFLKTQNFISFRFLSYIVVSVDPAWLFHPTVIHYRLIFISFMQFSVFKYQLFMTKFWSVCELLWELKITIKSYHSAISFLDQIESKKKIATSVQYYLNWSYIMRITNQFQKLESLRIVHNHWRWLSSVLLLIAFAYSASYPTEKANK